MKTKNISILLFILVFAGVALLGAAQVWALDCKDECENTGIPNQTCTDPYDYNIEVVPPMPGTPPVPCPNSPGEMCWPYEYQGCSTTAHDDERCAVKKQDPEYVPTANYWVFELDLRLRPLYGGASIGSQEEFDDIGPKCVNRDGERVSTSPGKYFLKLNFALNCGFNAIQPFVLYFKSDQLFIHPVRSFMVTSSECLDDYFLNAPDCVDYDVRETDPLCDGRIVVTREDCGGTITQVVIDDCPAQAGPAYICSDPGDSSTCDPVLGSGSGGGENAWLCPRPEDPPTVHPMYLVGDTVYYYQSCEE
jgi:hypothetical protein